VPIPILIDCDAGHDDTIALPLALVAAARARAAG
jgi:inosine-uridine nucleoside N-ribohydrolase